ncbi:MAG: hypothetical protein MJ069_04980 [Salinivirgaceae bacterium]|nr:hypothetical protein [Salinivirgaceae bacterium]
MANKILSVLFAIALLLPALNCSAGDTDKDWELVGQDSDIKVFERWVNLDKNQKARERSGRMVLNCTPEQLLSVLSDENKTDLWMSYVKECHIIKRDNDDLWSVYTLLDAPYPVGKQDLVTQYKVTRNGNNITLAIDQQNTLVPRKKDIERLDSFNALWEIRQVGEHTCSVVFTTQSTQPNKYPNWLQDPLVRKVFLQNMKKLRRHTSQQFGVKNL